MATKMRYRKVAPADVVNSALANYALNAEAGAYRAELELARLRVFPAKDALFNLEDATRTAERNALEARRDAETWAAGVTIDEEQIRNVHKSVLEDAVAGCEREHAGLCAGRDFKREHDLTVTEQPRIDVIEQAHKFYVSQLDAYEADEDGRRNDKPRTVNGSRSVKRAHKTAVKKVAAKKAAPVTSNGRATPAKRK